MPIPPTHLVSISNVHHRLLFGPFDLLLCIHAHAAIAILKAENVLLCEQCKPVRKEGRKNCADSEKPLPTLIKEKEPLWYRAP